MCEHLELITECDVYLQIDKDLEDKMFSSLIEAETNASYNANVLAVEDGASSGDIAEEHYYDYMQSEAAGAQVLRQHFV